MPFLPRPRFQWRLRTRTLALGKRTALMGILNVTPDSFSDGSRFFSVADALAHGLRLLDEGADILDIGGESTRPNASPVTPADEQARVLPVLRALRKARPNAILSVDTYHASTARAALEAGTEIVNDVSGLLWDPAMPATLATAQNAPGAILMHTRGAPRMWSHLPPLPHGEVLPLVVSGLTHTLNLARMAGMQDSRLVLDPGFGFGKAGVENFVLLAHLRDLHTFRLPLLVGMSRKRFLLMGEESGEARLQATIAANTTALLAGAHILRVHDVRAARAAADAVDAMLAVCEAAGCV